MTIEKSSRHQHIIGRFGEYLLCNWLSRSGFEVALVDHTGIDVIAFNPHTRQRLGISVKSRTRRPTTEATPVSLLRTRGEHDDRRRLVDACRSFACDPWVAVYIETENSGDLYLTSLQHYDTYYKGPEARRLDMWRMSQKYTERYERDSEVLHIRTEFTRQTWFTGRP